MATVATRPADPPATAPEPVRPEPYMMTVEDYDKIVEAGVFGDKSPIYLWKGQLVLPMTKGPSHEYSLTFLLNELSRLVPAGWHVRSSSPTRLGDHSEPEPDLTVARGSARDYKSRHPTARDVALAVEVAHSSRSFDTGDKLETYAAAGLLLYWVVNIPENRIDVYTGPSGPTAAHGYSTRTSYGPGEDVPVMLDGREVGRVAVSDVLP